MLLRRLPKSMEHHRPESILKSWIDLRHQIGAGLIWVRFGKRRSHRRVRVGIRGRQFRVWILHHTVPICWIWDMLHWIMKTSWKRRGRTVERIPRLFVTPDIPLPESLPNIFVMTYLRELAQEYPIFVTGVTGSPANSHRYWINWRGNNDVHPSARSRRTQSRGEPQDCLQ
jgi:hypothetical protein